jgi:methyl-accepting chemotaxis protein
VLLLTTFLPRTSEAQESVQLDPRIGLTAVAALVEQEFECVRDSLGTLATTENALSGDWERIKSPLTQLAKGMPISAAACFARPNGSYFTVESGLTDQNLKNRDYFPKLLAGEEVIGDLVISKSTGKRSAIIAVPIREEGRVIGALGISVAMEKVAASVEDEIHFPKNIMFYALDSHGQIALHRDPALLFEFAAQLEGGSLKAAVAEMLSKPEGLVHYEFQGAQRQAIFKRSKVSGWVYALRW